MNVDLTPQELARLIQWAEAGNMADPVTQAIHYKALQAAQSGRGRADFSDSPTEAAQKWRAPL